MHVYAVAKDPESLVTRNLKECYAVKENHRSTYEIKKSILGWFGQPGQC